MISTAVADRLTNGPKWPAPGIYRNVSPAEYFALTEIDGRIVRSNSTLKAFNDDPALFHAGYRKPPTKAMNRGSLFDCLLTSPHRFDEDFVCSEFKDFKSKAAQEWRDEQTKTIVTEKELKSAVGTIEAIQSDTRWQEMTEGSPSFQVAMRADFDGAPFKALIDLLPDEDSPYGDAIVDVKRLSQVETLEDVLRACRKLKYNRQGGLYRAMARELGVKRKRFILFIVPQAGPITPCVLDLDRIMLDNGVRDLWRMSERMAECERTGVWPGRFDGVKEIKQADPTWDWTEAEEELEATEQPAGKERAA
jgi:hypothetical protein